MSIPPPLAATRDLLVLEVAPKRARANTLVDSSARSPAQLVRGLASPDERHVLGGRVGRYHMREQLGEGGMGTVVEAYDETLGRRVALKLDAVLVDVAPSALDERDQVELERTFVWAHARGHDKVAIQAARRLSQVLAREHGEHEAAHAWQVTADAVLARVSGRGSCASVRPRRPAGPKD